MCVCALCCVRCASPDVWWDFLAVGFWVAAAVNFSDPLQLWYRKAHTPHTKDRKGEMIILSPAFGSSHKNVWLRWLHWASKGESRSLRMATFEFSNINIAEIPLWFPLNGWKCVNWIRNWQHLAHAAIAAALLLLWLVAALNAGYPSRYPILPLCSSLSVFVFAPQ